MKIMNSMKLIHLTYAAAVAFCGLAIAGTANAQSVGVDFYNNNNAANTLLGQTPLSTDVVGPVPTAGWNNYEALGSGNATQYPAGTNQYNGTDTGNPVTLLDTTGASSGIKFGFVDFGLKSLDGNTNNNSPGYGASGTPLNTPLTADQQLYNGAIGAGPGGQTAQFTLTNVPYASYSVYLLVTAISGGQPELGLGSATVYTGSTYAGAVAGPTYWFSGTNLSNGVQPVGPSNPGYIPPSNFTYVQATGTSQATATTNANYVLFTGLTGSTVSFDVSSPSVAYNGGAYISGFEIVAASVPEPSTYAMMLAGFGVLVVIARRRRVS